MGAPLRGFGHHLSLPFPPILGMQTGLHSRHLLQHGWSHRLFSASRRLTSILLSLKFSPPGHFSPPPSGCQLHGWGARWSPWLCFSHARGRYGSPSHYSWSNPPDSRDSVETGSVTADLHFPLYCTPYYGYTPQSEADFVTMTFTLADFLVYTCFTTDSEPNAALSNLSVRPGDLLTILSTIDPTFLSVSPGDGMFILPLTTSKAALRPFPVAWLYSVTEDDCPPPPFFVPLAAALGPGTDLYVSGIFQQALALGPRGCAYFNSSQLPLPYFRRTADLQVHTNTRVDGVDFGGYGAKQYHFVYSPDTHDKVSFSDLPVTPSALPETFLEDLLALEKWPPEATLLAPPNNTISWPENSSLRIWFPDVDSNLSPQHGITVCCGRAGDARARSHGPTMGYRDLHQESADGQGAVWNSFLSHVPQYESLASAFYCTMDHWVGYTTDAIPRSTIDPILTSYKALRSQYRAGLHAWRLPPHTLAYNLYTLVFSMYALDSLLLEGFGAGAYNAAVAALMAYRPLPKSEYSAFNCVLTCLWVASPCLLRFFKNSLTPTIKYTLSSLNRPLTPLTEGTASLTPSVSSNTSTTAFPPGGSTKSSWTISIIVVLPCSPCMMALTHNVTTLNATTKHSNLGHTLVTTGTTMKRLSPPSGTSRPPLFSLVFSSLWRMSNLRLEKALLVPHTALTSWTSFSGSFPTWVLPLLCILAPPVMPSPPFSFVGAIVPLMVIFSPCSTPLWTFMKVLRRSIPVLFSNSFAFLPSKTWASPKRMSTLLKTVYDRLSWICLWPKLWTSFTLSCLAACVSHRLPARTIILLPLLRLLRSSGISSGLRARLTLLPVLPLSMSGSLVRWLLTWLWLTSVVMPSRGHVFVGVLSIWYPCR